MATEKAYLPKHKIRIVTATSLYDGHDAAINIMRRVMQRSGVEVIHLGHNRSALEIVECAIQEDVQGIALTSYQGGHLEFFKYIYDLLKERNSTVKIIGGGGGTILPTEIKELHEHGIEQIYSPDDGRRLGLQGMINDALQRLDFSTLEGHDFASIKALKDKNTQLAKEISWIEANSEANQKETTSTVPVLGFTGTGGAGKSSLVDEFLRRFTKANPTNKVAVVSVDPSKRKTGGALLGDRIRMNAVHHPSIYMRSMATREANNAISKHLGSTLKVCKQKDFDLIILESSGIGQSDTSITDYCDKSVYVMTSEYGAASQLEKIDMLDFADFIVINKYEKEGAEDAFHDVCKQYRRNHLLWDTPQEDLPLFGTIASNFNDAGVDRFYNKTIALINADFDTKLNTVETVVSKEQPALIPKHRERYLAEIINEIEKYNKKVDEQAKLSTELYKLKGVQEMMGDDTQIASIISQKENELSVETKEILSTWELLKESYESEVFTYVVRGREIKSAMYTTSLSGTKVPKVVLPSYSDWGDIVRWVKRENVPGQFPYTAGVFPLKRKGESPTRMFAGEGNAERTNRRFHYLSLNSPANRLSTAFDSVTLYGEDPELRPDVYGKVGNSGVNVATLDDAKRLYSGFDLAEKSTSVSMTINGPAPIILSFFLNAAIDQQCEKYILDNGLEKEVKTKLSAMFPKGNQPQYNGELPEGHNGLGLMLLGVSGDQVLPAAVYEKIKTDTLQKVRGTVQADILKEDQAQNTCIFSTQFSMHLMGDVQQYFIDYQVRNFYSVSVSGYHIAEAGANPISQLAFTLSNGFTIVEYYLSRGMYIDDFAQNLSFFFSNGVDPEYAVIGRVARRIWATAIKYKYGGNERSQKLKYHIQTSGRSLHASEIAFNDIRTTLQALYAMYDNCNSLHTNAFDEAITTPTEDSVRRAVAIQLIIDKELGLSMNENPLQGAFIIEELTDLVEEAVLNEFQRISDRGGVFGAMERMYQRSKIQDESMYYEGKKLNGDLPLVGVNTFLNPKGSPTVIPEEVIRSTKEEKQLCIDNLAAFQLHNQSELDEALQLLEHAVRAGNNVFTALMEVTKVASLGQITEALYTLGGKYRRNM